ncbi:putative late blight resistance protein -like protein R1A-3-like [Capsicum annuum]|nr:putative late blight resistance protein -like protein R1A-3-like [Capsicum annuum]KAF3653808.1 putative late blight resistance protein -like protein R1A-3-like [Capsicum annuum]
MENVERIPSSVEPPTERSYPSVDGELVGFDDHAENIIQKLRERSMDFDIISVVGMAGIGKTALARKVYNSSSIIDCFDVRAWCSVGQTYNVRKLFLEILKQITGDRFVNVDDPDDMMRKNLFGKRYLIVLDDICEYEAWDDLRPCFPSVGKGSRIMVTTRNVQLTRHMKKHSEPYLLPCLRDEESWELLQKKVFQGESCPLELRSVGPLVAKKCNGLPLFIIIIAGILSRKKREASTWLEVAYDIGSHALEEGSMKMIQSSYDILAEYLKPCLLYMGLFPKGYEIPVSDLLKWWIAEEFVPNIGTLKQEETSMSCLSDLVSRNLVVLSKTRGSGEMKCCIVPDQVREFCLTKIKEEKFMQHVGKRLCMYIPDTMTSDFKERKSFGISQASLECIAHPKFSISKKKNLFPLLNNFRLIRVLHLLDFYLDDSWAAAFQSLTHLRYLAIFVKAFHFKWVSHLVHLQTLGVRSSYIMMSPAIWKLEKLRHVDINEFPIRWADGERVKFEEPTDVVLHNMKTLGTCSMSVADMTPKFWNKFPNLEQLRLHIDELGDVPYYSDSRLMTLEMFPSRLRNLSLSETFLTDEIVSSIAKLQHLETLKLSEIYFTGKKDWDLSDKTFERLKFLKLHRVFMTHWYCLDESFPELEYLVIKSCSKLEEIPLSFADVPTLRLIKVTDCSKSVGDSALKIEKEMEEYGCELQVHILKNDKDEGK